MRRLLWMLTPWIGWIFVHMSFVIPVNRLREANTLMAFHHPKPSYPLHILLVQQKAIPSLKNLDPTDSSFFTDLYSILHNLVDHYQLPAYRLIVNGREYQH